VDRVRSKLATEYPAAEDSFADSNGLDLRNRIKHQQLLILLQMFRKIGRYWLERPEGKSGNKTVTIMYVIFGLRL